jgi:hypothetical protein
MMLGYQEPAGSRGGWKMPPTRSMGRGVDNPGEKKAHELDKVPESLAKYAQESTSPSNAPTGAGGVAG